MKTKPPRLADVAKAADVSTATASMALNDTGGTRIGAGTRERVRAAAADLGYRPNRVASGLRTRRTHTLGFVGDDVATTPFSGQMIRGAHDAAREAGFMLLIVDTSGEAAETGEAVAALQERQIEGILLATMYHQVVKAPKAIATTPCVLLNARTPDGSASSVVPDERGGTLGLLAELTGAGHTRIGHITTTEDVEARAIRLATWRERVEANGLHSDDLLVEIDQATTRPAHAAALRLLDRPDRPTAVFCFNDRVAMGVYRAAAQLGLRIPEALSVVSYDDQELIAPELQPALISAALPHYEMGRWSVLELLRRLDNPEAATVQHLMPCPVVKRESVAPPR
ncbi:LacI family DNA-binding transcriptional regulator [Glycomyces buryatensis]|uniref:LacI family DNA-binding transcriptional regulator n=1 Tax=Glycomyces buryatensis TaxID=2570927 RepID=A0A4S8Q3J6_9ACTN|nr:LacI family DNA-binding transcriptional regulator [Glycomyces buryatensis]THV35199.1 LacI family DNA-binding transcriptional regulator [Glycomyces buryatensis]